MYKAIAFGAIILFIAAIIIGARAIQKETIIGSEAGQRCTTPEFPDIDFCPAGQSPDLVKDAEGCYFFECK